MALSNYEKYATVKQQELLNKERTVNGDEYWCI